MVGFINHSLIYKYHFLSTLSLYSMDITSSLYIYPLYEYYFNSLDITSTIHDLFALWILIPLYIISLLYGYHFLSILSLYSKGYYFLSILSLYCRDINSPLYYPSTLWLLLPLYIISLLCGHDFLSILYIFFRDITYSQHFLFTLWVLLSLYIISYSMDITSTLYFLSSL